MKSYAAILEGDRVVWQGDRPSLVQPQRVTIMVDENEVAASAPGFGVRSEPTPDQIEEAIRAMERIQRRGGIASIPDPVEWQREIRRDRPLPGRD